MYQLMNKLAISSSMYTDKCQLLHKLRSKIPYEIALQILDTTNIGDLNRDLIEELFPKLDGSKLLLDRQDPIRYLGKLIDRPKEVMLILLHTNSIISGSTASAFFAPGASSSDSDIDIYCPGESGYIIALTLALSKIGVKWTSSHINKTVHDREHTSLSTETSENSNDDGDSEDNEDDNDSSYNNMIGSINIIRGKTTTGKIKRKVQVMWVKGRPASSNVVLFHSTVTQCFISGFCAVSMYHSLTRENISVHWGYNDEARRTDNIDANKVTPNSDAYRELHIKYENSTPRSAQVADKYTMRGFKYIKYADMIRKFTIDSSRYQVLSDFDKDEEFSIVSRVRRIGDNESYIVPFSEYYISSDEQDTTYIHLCNTLISNICWQESCGTTTSIEPTPYAKSSIPAVTSKYNENKTLQLVLDLKLTRPGLYAAVDPQWKKIIPWAMQLYNPYSQEISCSRYGLIC